MFLLHKTFHNPVDSSWEIIRNIVEKIKYLFGIIDYGNIML